MPYSLQLIRRHSPLSDNPISYQSKSKSKIKSNPPPPSMKYLVIALTTEFEEHLSRTDAQTLSALLLAILNCAIGPRLPYPVSPSCFQVFLSQFPAPRSPFSVLDFSIVRAKI